MKAKNSPVQIAKAYELYLAGTLKLPEIAREAQVSLPVLRSWITEKGWRKKRESLERELIDGLTNEYRQLMARERLSVAQRHLEIAKKLEDAINRRLETVNGKVPFLQDATLLRLSNALKNSAEVSARASGMNTESQSGYSGNRPLVMIGINPMRIDHPVQVLDCKVQDLDSHPF